MSEQLPVQADFLKNLETDMKKNILPTLLVACLVASPALVQAADLTYPEIVKIIGSNKGVAGKLVGKKSTLTLISSGPDSLMVKSSDLTFFTCDKRDTSFSKGGTLTAKITKYGEDEDGNPVMALDRCTR